MATNGNDSLNLNNAGELTSWDGLGGIDGLYFRGQLNNFIYSLESSGLIRVKSIPNAENYEFTLANVEEIGFFPFTTIDLTELFQSAKSSDSFLFAGTGGAGDTITWTGSSGTDTLLINGAVENNFTYSQDDSGVIHVDSSPGASHNFKFNLTNVEHIKIGQTLVDLTLLFPDSEGQALNGTEGDDTFYAEQSGQIASLDGLGGTDTLLIDGRVEDKFSYTQDDSGAIHVDSLSGASHDYEFELTNVEQVQLGETVIDLTSLFPAASEGDDILFADAFRQTATWNGRGGTDTLVIDGRVEDKFSYTQDDAGVIHVDSLSGASHDYEFELTNVEKVQLGETVIDLTSLFPAATSGDDILFADAFRQTATWNGQGGTDTLLIDGRVEDKFSYTQDDSGAIHVDSISGASHEYKFTLTNVEKVQLGETIVDLTVLFPEESNATGAPIITLLNPSDNATNVQVDTDIAITFSESVSRGTGVISIKHEDGHVVDNQDVATSQALTFSNSILTINPTFDFEPSTGYTVEIAQGSILDNEGNSFSGTSTGTYNFTTAGAGTVIVGGAEGNDILTGSAGNDDIDGGAGLDTLELTGNSSRYNVTRTDTGFTVTGAEGTDSLSNVERLNFSDKNIALDIDGNAGQAYRIYKAAFDRVPDNGGLGFWINELDNGSPLLNVAAGFTNSSEFASLYGENSSNEAFLILLYFNVLDRLGDQFGREFWLDHLNSGAMSREQVLIDFSESVENKSNVIELIANGIEYTPFI